MRDKLEVYYNKFNEDKRLKRRHGNVEFQVTFSYILKYLDDYKNKNALNNYKNQNLINDHKNLNSLEGYNENSSGKYKNQKSLDDCGNQNCNNSLITTHSCTKKLENNLQFKDISQDSLNENCINSKNSASFNISISMTPCNKKYGLIELETFTISEAEKQSNHLIKIADIGAGTGRYSIPLHNLGFDVLAVEPFKCNLNKLIQNNPNVPTMLGDARNLKKLTDNSFDLTLLFGPMYHLGSVDEKLKALLEAERITKPNGIIMVAYITNEYSVITHAFKSHKFGECKKNGQLSEDFKTIYTERDLYSYMRISDIDNLLTKAPNLKRINIFGADGPAEYMRREINEMTEPEYAAFIQFVRQIAERKDLLGASAHIVDVLVKN